jgi:hypothetical protein
VSAHERHNLGAHQVERLTVCWVRLECAPRDEPLLEACDCAYSSVSVILEADEGG